MNDDRRPLESFDEAFPTLLAAAYKVAYRLVGDVAGAEDVAAEALARTLLAWPKVGGLPYRDAWVARVAANLAIDEQRRRSRRWPWRSRPVDGQADPFTDVAAALDLAADLGRLTSRQREIVALRFLAGFPEAEVAGLLGITVNSVHTHATRALSSLRERMVPDPETREKNLAVE